MTDKNRYWWFVLYPESAPKDWQNILQMTGLQYFISPLHDKDKNPDNTLKKAHYHIILLFTGPTTFKKVNSLCKELNCPIPLRILSLVGAYRYLTHRDNPEKYQYSENDIIAGNGVDVNDVISITQTELLHIKRDIIHIITKEQIIEYCDLIDFLDHNELYDYLHVVMSNTILFDKYITSVRHKIKELSV